MKIDKIIEEVNQLIERDKQLSELIELFKYDWETSDHIVKENGKVDSHLINDKVVTKYELSEIVMQPLGYFNGCIVEPRTSLDIVYDFRKKYNKREFECHLYIYQLNRTMMTISPG